MNKFFLLGLTYLLSFQTALSQAQIQQASKREFRGAWVATVSNIDWPSKPNLSTEEQKKELINILDHHQQSGMNAIMLQIRPAADAFYGQGKELWSRFLTGVQGKAPQPYYDPLAFAIEETHKRGIATRLVQPLSGHLQFDRFTYECQSHQQTKTGMVFHLWRKKIVQSRITRSAAVHHLGDHGCGEEL